MNASNKQHEWDKLISENKRLKEYLYQINNYDKSVQAVISSNEEIKKAWDKFKVLYVIYADDELIEKAENKIYRNTIRYVDGNVCPTCNLPKSRYEKGVFD